MSILRTPERHDLDAEGTPDGAQSAARIERWESPGDSDASPATGAAPRARAGLWIAVALLLLGSLPDAMVPPVLGALVVDHLGMGESVAHWFMSVNLIGAVAAVPLLMWLRRLLSPTRILIAAAVVDAIVLATLFATTSFTTALWLRGLEGMADLIVLAVLLDLVAKSGGVGGRGRRMGLGATTLLLGLGIGALVGGRFDARPEGVFLLGAISSSLLAVLALAARRPLGRAVASCPVIDAMETLPASTRRVWPVVCMMAGDRALAGVLTVTIPLLLAARFGWSAGEIGWVIAVPLLLMAVLAWPAGYLGDRVGNLQLRAVAGLVYAATLALLPAAAGIGLGAAMLVVAPMGIAAAALMPSTMALAARTGRGSVAMAAVHAGGNVGYLIGIAGGGALLGLVGGLRPDAGAYALVVVLFALGHVVLTGMATLSIVRISVRPAPNPARAAEAVDRSP